MQYINSNLGIPIKASFADMMGVNSYSNASGDSVSSLESKIASIQKEISSLEVKKQKEELKLSTEQDKKKRAAAKMTIVGGYKFREGERELRQANVAINQAKTEIRNIDNKIKSLSIDLSDLQNRLKLTNASIPATPSTPKPPVPSVPPILDAANIPLGGVFPPRDGVTGTTSQDGSTDTGKSKVNYPVVIIGSVVVLGILYFAVIK